MLSSVLLILCFLLTFSALAQTGNSLKNYLLQIQYKNQILKGSRERRQPVNPEEACYKRFQTLKKIWDEEVKSKNKKLIVEGSMNQTFTREEILSMKMENPHGLKGKVRGTDKYITGGYSYSHAPSFPHTAPGCEKVFKEEVKVIDIQGLKCREIKFSQEAHQDVAYFQVYCQDSKDVRISFDKQNDFSPEELLPVDKDCIHCQK